MMNIVNGPLTIGVLIITLFVISCEPRDLNELMVTLEESRRAAEFELINQANSGFTNWKNAQLAEYYIFYDLEGKPSAFMYICRIEDEIVGYITVSASKRFAPIIESSTSNKPPMSKYEENLAFGNNYENEILDFEYIYLGGLTYFIKYSINGMEPIYVNLSTPIIVIEDESFLEIKQKNYKKSEYRNAESSWNAILNSFIKE